ncbi:hypothetical protein CNECB9_3740021 [Cupriavidus necator]|uniref:Uncharacterized protein n=1 Tax=Cupriavidus necator TaxID=106590 RepID=A0A1K0JGU5_CUPNE|nr:hypothetical protein CNECB9_3740021 [Cupriavidus necator]
MHRCGARPGFPLFVWRSIHLGAALANTLARSGEKRWLRRHSRAAPPVRAQHAGGNPEREGAKKPRFVARLACSILIQQPAAGLPGTVIAAFALRPSDT